MAQKKKDKHGSFEECSAVSFAPSSSAPAQPITLSHFPHFALNRQNGSSEAAAAQNFTDKTDKNAHKNTEKNAAKGKDLSSYQAKPHYEGHRQRLRLRFLNGGNDMADYEFLELLLFRSVPRRDTKPLAKALLAHFGSLGEVLAADMQRLKEVKNCGDAIALDIKLIHAAAARMLRSDLPKRNIFTSWDKLIAYCRSVMAYEEREQFRILFLDKKNGLIADEILQTGTVDHTPVYPRDVVKRALDLAASAIILLHNHPSGDPTPSRQDIAMTAKLQEITRSMNIVIHDHLIIGRNGYASFRELDLL